MAWRVTRARASRERDRSRIRSSIWLPPLDHHPPFLLAKSRARRRLYSPRVRASSHSNPHGPPPALPATLCARGRRSPRCGAHSYADTCLLSRCTGDDPSIDTVAAAVVAVDVAASADAAGCSCRRRRRRRRRCRRHRPSLSPLLSHVLCAWSNGRQRLWAAGLLRDWVRCCCGGVLRVSAGCSGAAQTRVGEH